MSVGDVEDFVVERAGREVAAADAPSAEAPQRRTETLQRRRLVATSEEIEGGDQVAESERLGSEAGEVDFDVEGCGLVDVVAGDLVECAAQRARSWRRALIGVWIVRVGIRNSAQKTWLERCQLAEREEFPHRASPVRSPRLRGSLGSMAGVEREQQRLLMSLSRVVSQR